MPVEDGDWTVFDQEEAAVGYPIGPGPSSTAPDHPTEPHRAEAEQEQVAEVLEFDPKMRLAFEGLLYIGHLEDEFEWLGHHFKIRSLKGEEILEIGLLHKPFVGSMGDVKAYQMLMVAACVVSIDGKPMPLPLGPGSSALTERFEYARRNWYPQTFDAIYERYLLLEQKVEEVIEALGKASGWTAESILSSTGTSV